MLQFYVAFISFVSVHIFEHIYYCSFLLLKLGLHSQMLVLNYIKNWKHEYQSLVSEKEGGSLGGQWSFEKSRRSSHFVCTCFIVVGTRLSKYRQLPMALYFRQIFEAWGGEIFNQSTLFSIIIALPETFIVLQLNYYSIY